MKNIEKWIIIVLSVIAAVAIGTAIYLVINKQDVVDNKEIYGIINNKAYTLDEIKKEYGNDFIKIIKEDKIVIFNGETTYGCKYNKLCEIWPDSDNGNIMWSAPLVTITFKKGDITEAEIVSSDNEVDSERNDMNKDNLDKEDGEHGEYDPLDIRIFSTEDFKVNYIKNHTGYDGTNYCKINDKGFLEGFCYNKEIKDIQFIALAERFYEFYPDGIYALSIDGFIYELDYNLKYDANDELVKDKDADVSKFKTKHDGKITNIGFMESNSTGDCMINNELIYTANGVNYIDNGEITFENRIKNESLFMLVSCGIGGNASFLTDISLNYDKTIKLSNGVNVKDFSTKKDIIAKYVAYEYKENKETIYIVSEDNKLYKMYKEEEFINPVDIVLDVKYSYIDFENEKDLEIKTNEQTIILSGY